MGFPKYPSDRNIVTKTRDYGITILQGAGHFRIIEFGDIPSFDLNSWIIQYFRGQYGPFSDDNPYVDLSFEQLHDN